MSDVNNPLFDNQREFLERQKEEYKNALMGDVEHIKTQGQEVGKKVAVAGGVLLAGYLIKRMLSSGDSKKKARKVSKAEAAKKAKIESAGISHPIPDYDPIAHAPETVYNTEPVTPELREQKLKKAKKKKSGPGMLQSLMKSDYTRTLALEGIALLVAYITKKAADRMQNQSENTDIAEKAVPATEADPVVQSVSETKHAI